MIELEFHPEASDEYGEAFRWYEMRSASAALRFEAEVESTLTRIRSDPTLFPHYDKIHQFAVVDRFRYSIVYRAIGRQHVHIVALPHSSRRPGYWSGRR